MKCKFWWTQIVVDCGTTKQKTNPRTPHSLLPQSTLLALECKPVIWQAGELCGLQVVWCDTQKHGWISKHILNSTTLDSICSNSIACVSLRRDMDQDSDALVLSLLPFLPRIIKVQSSGQCDIGIRIEQCSMGQKKECRNRTTHYGQFILDQGARKSNKES